METALMAMPILVVNQQNEKINQYQGQTGVRKVTKEADSPPIR